ncbi:MAG: T9SS type A sorting domain-containing protein [Bacteroidia bacterium]
MKKSNRTTFLFALLGLVSQLSFAQVLQLATYQFNGKGDFSDKYQAIVTDNAGNMLVAGYTISSKQNRNILLQKLSTSSNFALWTKTVNGSANGIDEAVAITTDAANNIYLAAFQSNENTGKDILTQKYSATGTLLWTQTYNHTDNLDDVPVGIYLDNNGKVVVCGTSNSTTQKDVVLLQYTTNNGTMQWTKRWNNATANQDDEAVAAVVNAANEIVVIATSSNIVDTDIVMAKYSETGLFLWSQTIDKGNKDQAAAITLDAADNLYMTGSIYQGNNWNVLITKYNSGGFLEWEQILNYVQDDIAVSIGLDANDNTYVLSKSDVVAGATVSYDALVSKWDVSGTQLWAETWNSPLNKSDLPAAMKIMPSGEAVVVGTSLTSTNNSDVFTAAFNTTGGILWESVYDGTSMRNDGGLALAVKGNDVFTVGYLGNADNQADAVLLKNTNSSALQYFFLYEGKGDNNDGIRASTYLDSTSQLFVTGYSATDEGNKDVWVAKMNNSTNAPVWAKTLLGKSVTGEDEGVAIALDTQFDAYVAAKMKDANGKNNIAVIKLKNSNGDTLWVRYFMGANNLNREPVSMHIDAQNNIYVAGITQISDEHYDFLLLKYNTSGVLQWSKTFNGSGDADDRLSNMIVYNNFIYLIGNSRNTTTNLHNISLIKYDNTGNVVWQKNYGIATEDEKVKDLFVDAAENVYFTGTKDNGTTLDILTVKYDNAGIPKWVKLYDGGDEDEARGVVADVNGKVTIAGTSRRTTSGSLNDDMMTLQYSSTGTQNWVEFFNGNQNEADIADDLTIDNAGNVYVFGHSNNGTAANPNFDFVILRYAPDSTLQWSDNIMVTDSLDKGVQVYVKNDLLFLMGDVWANEAQTDLFIMKYQFTGVLDIETAANFGNAQAFPNPFQENFFIHLDKPQAAEIHLYNQLGQDMPIQVQSYGYDYQINTTHLPAGIYFYQVKAENQLIASGKVVKLQR